MYYEIQGILWKISVLEKASGKVSKAASAIAEFSNSVANVKKVLGDNIKIDDKIYCKECFDRVSQNITNSSSTMKSAVSSITGEIQSLQYQAQYIYEMIRQSEIAAQREEENKG